MTWRSFIDFVLMREMGQQDAIMRNYDLTFHCSFKPPPGVKYTFALCAADRLGVHTDKIPFNTVLTSVAAQLASYGYKVPSLDWLETTMNEWYVWDRIRLGEVQRWKRRRQPNPIL